MKEDKFQLEKIFDFFKNNPYLIILSIFSISFTLCIGGNWLSEDCSATTIGDLETHYAFYKIFGRQLRNYHSIFPVDFSISAPGNFVYRYSSIVYLIPYILYILTFDLRNAFILTHFLFYSLSAVSMYLLLKNLTKNKFSSFIISFLFFVSPTLNVQFSVYGSYHTLVSLNFMLLSLNSLVSYERESSKKNLILLLVFSFLCAITHVFTFVFYTIILAFYIIIKRDPKLALYLTLIILCTSYYYMPLFYDKLFVSGFSEASSNPGIVGVIKSSFSFVPQNYTWKNDYNYGPFILTLFLISSFLTFFSFHPKGLIINRDVNKFIVTLLLSTILIFTLYSYFPLFRDLVPNERIAFYLQIFFYIIIGNVFSKYKPSLIMCLFLITLGALLSPNTELYIGTFITLFLIISIKIVKKKKFPIHLEYLIGSLFFLILLLPSVNLFHETNVAPRIWCYHFPDSSKSLLDSNSVYFSDVEGGATIGNVYGSKRGASIGSSGGAELNLEYSVNNETVLENLESIGVTNIIAWRDYPHLNNWFFDSEEIMCSRRGIPYSFTYYSTNFNNIHKDIEILSPTHLIVDTSDMEFIPIYYHPLWKSETNLSNHKGYIGFNSSKDTIELKFDTSLFKLSNLLSLAGFATLFLFLKEEVML